jgi:putative ABC transport system substrate-binding protein
MMTRRELIALAAGTATWALAANAQQPAMPVIGLLSSVESYAERLTAFRTGLEATGFVERANLTIEYRSADGRAERLPTLAAELVRQQVAVIVTIGGDSPAHAAKAATSVIPIVFATGSDAQANGLVTHINRPEANLTGVSFSSTEMQPKRLELLRDLLPRAKLFGVLMGSMGDIDRFTEEGAFAARNAGIQALFSRAGSEAEIDKAFETFRQQGVSAIVVSNDAFLNSARDKIISLAARAALPAIYAYREHIRAGALMSYGADVNEMYRQVGIYTGRLLKGARPGDLPVQTPRKFELLINLRTAKSLGIAIPPSLLARADEVIE